MSYNIRDRDVSVFGARTLREGMAFRPLRSLPMISGRDAFAGIDYVLVFAFYFPPIIPRNVAPIAASGYTRSQTPVINHRARRLRAKLLLFSFVPNEYESFFTPSSPARQFVFLSIFNRSVHVENKGVFEGIEGGIRLPITRIFSVHKSLVIFFTNAPRICVIFRARSP